MDLFEQLLVKRGLTGAKRERFLNPVYDDYHDPFLLPDMKAAVDRLVKARRKQEKVTVYGDYDIDGLTATTVLLEAFDSFGYEQVSAYTPNRFVEGYGLAIEAVEKIAATGTKLIVTVDCGSLSEKEIQRANELGVDVIVTDHHNVAKVQPPAVAVINPKRLLEDYPDDYEGFILKAGSPGLGELYPFLDLAGVGVAFKLVQALQTKLEGLPSGQEKWLLDLVALGTVCDVVSLIDENRMFVYWGLKVLAKARRPGLKSLMAVSGVEPALVNTRSLGFALGPRMNAAGRLETAEIALTLLRTRSQQVALERANQLDEMNVARRHEQDRILKEAVIQAEKFSADPVLVVSSSGWSHGIIGIVAAKLLEKYQKPTFVLEEMGEEAKGSARSYGDFSAADAIRSADDVITKGGGHKFAAGVTLPSKNIGAFRERVNQYYRSLKLNNQALLLLPQADVEMSFAQVDFSLIDSIKQLEPFGQGNLEPGLKTTDLVVEQVRRMGNVGQHVKLSLRDSTGKQMEMLSFNAPESFFCEIGEVVDAWYRLSVNEWRGNRRIEGYLLHIDKSTYK